MMFSRGVIYMVLSVFFFTVMSVFVKLVNHLPAIEVVFFRAFISLVISWSILKVQKVRIFGKPEHRKFLIGRGVFGTLGVIGFFSIIQSVPLASASVLGFMAPIFVTIFSIFMARERVFNGQWIFISLAFAGIFMVKGFDTRVDWIWIGVACLASMSIGISHNHIRMLGTHEHPLVIMFYFPLVATPVTGIPAAINWVMPQGIDWLYLLGIGICTQIAQWFMTKSYTMEEISKVSITRYVSIVFSLAFGWLVFGEQFGWLAYAGMGVTILGVVGNLYYKTHRERLLANRNPSPSV